MIVIADEIKTYFSQSTPLFDQIMALRGTCFRDQEGRLTQRIILGNTPYFIKQHRGVGFGEIIKNLLQGRLPVISAKNEWRALQKLASLGIAVPRVLGYGERGMNPAKRQSFIIMEALQPSISLEDLTKEWKKQPPKFANKFKLIKAVASIARIMHQHGINHRDFYICHFLQATKADSLALYLIDLHRAQMRKKTPRRWLLKDLAGLYFSSKEISLSKRDYYRFMRLYQTTPLREIIKDNMGFWQQVRQRGEQLYRDHLS